MSSLKISQYTLKVEKKGFKWFSRNSRARCRSTSFFLSKSKAVLQISKIPCKTSNRLIREEEKVFCTISRVLSLSVVLFILLPKTQESHVFIMAFSGTRAGFAAFWTIVFIFVVFGKKFETAVLFQEPQKMSCGGAVDLTLAW